MGDHRGSPGGGHDLDGVLDRRRPRLDVRGTARDQVDREGSGPVRRSPAPHQGVGHVRAPGDRSAGDGQHVDQLQGGHPRGDLLHQRQDPAVPLLDAAGEQLLQLRVVGVGLVRQEVMSLTSVLDRELGPVDEGDAQLVGGGIGLSPACEGVVVGQGEHGQADLHRPGHQLSGGVRAVGGVGMGVQIDHLDPRRLPHSHLVPLSRSTFPRGEVKRPGAAAPAPAHKLPARLSACRGLIATTWTSRRRQARAETAA